MNDILELNVMAELEQAAPRVVLPIYEAHKSVVKALGMWASSHKSQLDSAGLTYWRASLADILNLAAMPELAPKVAGSICRKFRLVMKRENDGYYAAWSEKKLGILKKVFDLA